MLLRNGKAVQNQDNSSAVAIVMDDRYSMDSQGSNEGEGNDRSHSSRSDISSLPAASPLPHDDSLGLIDPRDDRHSVPNPIPGALDIPLYPSAGPGDRGDFMDGGQGSPFIVYQTPPIDVRNGYASTSRTYFNSRAGDQELDFPVEDNDQPTDHYEPPQGRETSRRSYGLTNGSEEESHHSQRNDATAGITIPRRRATRRRETRLINETNGSNAPADTRMDSHDPGTSQYPRQRLRDFNPQVHNHLHEEAQIDLVPYAYAPPPQPHGRRQTRSLTQMDLTIPQVTAPYSQVNHDPTYTTPQQTGQSANTRSNADRQPSMTSHLREQHLEPGSYFQPQTYAQTYAPTQAAHTPYTDHAPPWSPGPSSEELHDRRQSLLPTLGYPLALSFGTSTQEVGEEEGGGMGGELDRLLGRDDGVQFHGSGQGRNVRQQQHVGQRGAEQQQTTHTDTNMQDDDGLEHEVDEGTVDKGRNSKSRPKRRRSAPSTAPSGHASKRRHHHRRGRRDDDGSAV